MLNLFVSVTLSLFFFTHALQAQNNACEYGKVVRTNGDSLNVRSAPKGGTVIGRLTAGSIFRIYSLETAGDQMTHDKKPDWTSTIWFEIEFGSGRGWVSRVYVDCSEAPTTVPVPTPSGTPEAKISAFLNKMSPDGFTDRRLISHDLNWLLPLRSNILSSHEADHLGRGSVNAWDITAQLGDPIFAVGQGEVIYVSCSNEGGYGCWVKIQHPNGLMTSYAHMQRGSIKVKLGEEVDEHTILGNVGCTGMTSFGPHVHFTIVQSGKHLRIDDYFPRNRMNYQKFCCEACQ